MGGLKTFSGQGFRFVLQIASLSILARLLQPEDFGLVGMASVVVGFIGIFKDIGLTQATIQRPEISHQEISTVFWINVALGLICATILVLCSPLIASFYGRAELVGISIVLAGSLAIQSLSSQHSALLLRSMRYGATEIIAVIASLTALLVAIWMASRGYGYRSLVAQVLASAIVNCVLTWIFAGWVPGKPSLSKAVVPYLSFGGHLAGFNVLNFFSRNADNVLIGYFMGATSLGFYSKGYQILMMPVAQINGPATKLMLPVLSRLQEEPERYRSAYMRSVGAVASLSIPIVGFCWLAADRLVFAIFGPGWAAVTPVFLALLPATLVSLLNVATAWVFLSFGQTDRLLKWTIFAAPVNLSAMIIGLPYGIIGVGVAVSVSYTLMRIPYIIYAYKGTPLTLMLLGEALYRPAFNTLFASLIGWWTTSILPEAGLHSIFELSVLGAVFALAYGVADFIPVGKVTLRNNLAEMIIMIRKK